MTKKTISGSAVIFVLLILICLIIGGFIYEKIRNNNSTATFKRTINELRANNDELTGLLKSSRDEIDNLINLTDGLREEISRLTEGARESITISSEIRANNQEARRAIEDCLSIIRTIKQNYQ